jgi:hypothetical protein
MLLVPETEIIDHQETRQREPGPVTKERKRRDTPVEVPGKPNVPPAAAAREPEDGWRFQPWTGILPGDRLMLMPERLCDPDQE